MSARGGSAVPVEPEPQAPAGGYPPALPWARLMDDEDLHDFLDELAASATTHASGEVALAEVEDTIARWRVIGEAQHGHNTAPGPDAMTRTFVPVASLRENEPRPKFFQPGHLYTARVGWPNGRERFRFRCDSVTTDPATGQPMAHGQHGRLRTADGEWIWTPNPRTFDDWRGGAWTDITEEQPQSLREDVYESPLRHEYRVGHDLPATGGPQ